MMISKVLKISKSIFYIFFTLLFLAGSSCSSNSQNDSFLDEEHRALESLFAHFLLYEGGAYTLFGTKPLSFVVFSRIPDQEKQEFFSFSTHPILVNELNFFENWNIWKRLESRFSMSRFLFFERKPPPFSTGDSSVFLVNISTTASILQKHYERFKAVIGRDFDPLDSVFEIQDVGSKFWDIVLAREDLLGILLGYGEANPTLFVQVKEWEKQKSQIDSPKNRFFSSLSTQTPGSNSFASFDVSFPLPCFGCYEKEESASLIKKYENERKMIKALLYRKDFVQIAIDRLLSRELSTNPDDQYQEKLVRSLGIKGQLQH